MTRFEDLDAARFALPEETLARTLTPALVVYLDHVRENVRRVLELTGGHERWRPHVKTTKIPAVYAELVRAGLRHFKCAITREARHLLATLTEEGVPKADVLLAYPLLGPALEALGTIAEAHPESRVSVLCEDPEIARRVPAGVSIFVDVNPGMNRTGVAPEDLEAIVGVAREAGARFRGIHYYDGHLYQADAEERRREAFACYDRLVRLWTELSERGLAVGEIVTSGTPSFMHALAYAPLSELDGTLHRVSPGTVVYHDLRSQQQNPELELLPAALVLTRIVSRPAPDIVTCDAGSKSVAAEAGDPCAFALGHPELEPLTPSEEHLPLRVLEGALPARGTELLLVPLHVCPTVNLAEEALLVEGGRVVGLAPVSARAHDVLL